MNRKKTMHTKLLATCLLLAVILATTPRLASAAVYTSASSTFSVPLLANITPRTPSNYQFGTGTWAGSVDSVNMVILFSVTLTGATPNTSFLVRVSFFDALGNTLTRSYGLMTTDATGNAFDQEKSQIFAGTVRIELNLYDKTNFSPPLNVLISDPNIGGDVPL